MTEQTNSNKPANKPATTPENNSKGFSIASMVCGIVSLAFCWNIWIAVVLAIVALVFGIVVLVKKYPSSGMAIAGIITGGIGLVLTIVLYALALATVNSLVDSIENYDWDSIDWSDFDWDE